MVAMREWREEPRREARAPERGSMQPVPTAPARLGGAAGGGGGGGAEEMVDKEDAYLKRAGGLLKNSVALDVYLGGGLQPAGDFSPPPSASSALGEGGLKPAAG